MNSVYQLHQEAETHFNNAIRSLQENVYLVDEIFSPTYTAEQRLRILAMIEEMDVQVVKFIDLFKTERELFDDSETHEIIDRYIARLNHHRAIILAKMLYNLHQNASTLSPSDNEMITFLLKALDTLNNGESERTNDEKHY